MLLVARQQSIDWQTGQVSLLATEAENINSLWLGRRYQHSARVTLFFCTILEY